MINKIKNWIINKLFKLEPKIQKLVDETIKLLEKSWH